MALSRFYLRKSLIWVLLPSLLLFGLGEEKAQALTANKVWFEFHPGFYRVIVQYTIPALKQYRQAEADFTNKKKAEEFYFKLLRGGDFYLGEPSQIRFNPTPRQPEPW